MQADVSTSETESAVTCVSERSGNTQNDNASTKALAGSVYRQVIARKPIESIESSEINYAIVNIIRRTSAEQIKQASEVADHIVHTAMI